MGIPSNDNVFGLLKKSRSINMKRIDCLLFHIVLYSPMRKNEYNKYRDRLSWFKKHTIIINNHGSEIYKIKRWCIIKNCYEWMDDWRNSRTITMISKSVVNKIRIILSVMYC